MEVTDLPSPEAPDMTKPSGDTGAGFQSEEAAPAPGTPEYLGHMAKRGGASDEEVAMIVAAAQKNDPNYQPPEDNTNGDDSNAGDGDGSTTGDNAGDSDSEGDGSDGDNADGLTLESLQTEATENNGKLTEETLAKLEAVGFDRAEVEKYVDAQYKLATAEATRITAEIYSEVGGKDRYLEMIEWAGNNMPMSEVKSINSDLKSGDVTKVKDAMGRLNKRYTAKNGQPPRKIQRGSKQTNTAPKDVFRSQAELTAAMNDARYRKDPAYRADVAKKLQRSPAFRMG